jgi:2',3'-cyclic-nucleotide 2'-phosphodiesterase (5'-nucleotidase family)
MFDERTMMKRLLILSLTSFSLLAAQPSSQNLVRLTLLHWNDFHSYNSPYKITVYDSLSKKDTSYYVGGTATLLGYLNKFRHAYSNVVTFFAGDDFTGTPISPMTKGRSQIELMNIINPTAVTLGNHEFDYGSTILQEHLNIAKYPVLCANVWDEQNNRFFVSPSAIVQVGGMRLGIIGFTPPELPILVVRENLPGLRMLTVDSVLAIQIAQLKKEAVDLIILVSHMGIQHDTTVAAKFRDINVIVGGHDHIPLFTPIRKNRAIIVQAGSNGRWLGKLELVVDVAGDSVYSYSGSLIETRVSDITPDTIAAQKVEELEALVGAEMREVIGELKTPWRRSRGDVNSDSNIGNWQADVMRDYARADVAFQNNGGIRADLPAGPITVGDIMRINPFGNYFVVFSVNGATLRKMIEFQTRVNPREFVQVSGLRYIFDSSKPPGERLIDIEVHGKKIEDNRTYRVVTNNYVFSNLEAHFGVSPAQFQPENLPLLDREVFIERIRQDKQIHSEVDGRISDIARRPK